MKLLNSSILDVNHTELEKKAQRITYSMDKLTAKQNIFFCISVHLFVPADKVYLCFNV
jgi:hypothetical protein